MGLKKDLTTLNKFADNPYEATYRPEKELKRLFIGLMVTLPIFLGFCCEFYILISGPLFIYWVITFFKVKEYWKEIGWKKIYLYLPTIIMAVLGIFLAMQKALPRSIGWVFREVLGFK